MLVCAGGGIDAYWWCGCAGPGLCGASSSGSFGVMPMVVRRVKKPCYGMKRM